MVEKRKVVVYDHLQTQRDILAECTAQDAKWGRQDHSAELWLTILMEELGEAAKAYLDERRDRGRAGEYRKEMVQVAAVALAAIECCDRFEYYQKRRRMK